MNALANTIRSNETIRGSGLLNEQSVNNSTRKFKDERPLEGGMTRLEPLVEDCLRIYVS